MQELTFRITVEEHRHYKAGPVGPRHLVATLNETKLVP
jgi:hypothetical protein